MKTKSEIKQAATPIQKREIFWVDVNDHLPDDEITVLLAYFFGDVGMGFHAEGDWCDMHSGTVDESEERNRVTHWADIPEPPDRDSKFEEGKTGGKR